MAKSMGLRNKMEIKVFTDKVKKKQKSKYSTLSREISIPRMTAEERIENKKKSDAQINE